MNNQLKKIMEFKRAFDKQLVTEQQLDSKVCELIAQLQAMENQYPSKYPYRDMYTKLYQILDSIGSKSVNY